MFDLTKMHRHGVGYDYIHNDADGANMRLDVRSQVKYVTPVYPPRLSQHVGPTIIPSKTGVRNFG